MMDDSCKHCRFFHSTGDTLGECHRYAPRPIVINAKTQAQSNLSIYEMAQWPTVGAGENCGEFKPWPVTKND